MAPGDTARLYHALSSYSPGRWDPVTDRIEPIDDPRVLRDFVTNDIPFFPAPCKMYPRGDSELPGLLGEPLAGLELTCAGYPTRRPWRGGTAGAPVALPPPAPRRS